MTLMQRLPADTNVGSIPVVQTRVRKLVNLTRVTKSPRVRVTVTRSALPELDFSSAKTGLSGVMNEVVREHRPQVVRRHGREAMLLASLDDLQRWLETFRLNLVVTLGDGDVAISAAPLDVLGVGESFDAALENLAEALRVYAAQFFERASFYSQTDRAAHYPYLLRFALAPPERHLDLLRCDIKAAEARASVE